MVAMPFGVIMAGVPFDYQPDILRRILFREGLLLFREQSPTVDDLRNLAGIFGRIWRNNSEIRCILDQNCPDIIRVGDEIGADNLPNGIFGGQEIAWHCDGSILSGDYFGTILYGHRNSHFATTYWCHSKLALAGLSVEEQRELRGVQVQYCCQPERFEVASNNDEVLARIGSALVSQAIMRSHPVTGETVPLVSPASVVDGPSQDMVLRIANKMVSHGPVYAHQWRDGDLVIFDNLMTMHRRSATTSRGRELWRLQFNYENCGAP